MTRRTTRIVVAAVGAVLAAAAATPVVTAHAAWSSSRANEASGVSAATIGATTGATVSAPFGCANAVVSWSAASGAETYQVERSLDSGTTWATIASDAGAGTSFADATLPSTFTARYRVTGRVVPGTWTGAPATTTDAVCANARDLVATLGDGSASLAWSAATGGTGYEVQRRVGSADWATIAPAHAGTAYTDATQQSAGTVVSYRVRAVKGALTGAWTNVASVTWTAGAQDATVTRTITSDWTDGYCANVTVRNDGSTPLTWRVELAMGAWPYRGTVTQQQNVTTISTTSTVWTVEGVSWNRTLAPGASTSFTYCANRPTPAVTPADVSVRVTNEWATGYCGAGTVTTSSIEPIIWRVTLTRSMAPFTDARYWPASAPGMSNGATISLSSSAWVVGGASWNQVIQAGQTREFSWCTDFS